MRLTANKIAGVLRQHGYKLTPQRHALLKVIAGSKDHLSPGAIYEKARKEFPTVGLVTVYRTLDLLTDLGLVCRIHMDGTARSYMMRRPTEHHHHLICASCGIVIDFTDCSLNKLEQQLSRKTNFKIERHLLELYGRCQSCQETNPA